MNEEECIFREPGARCSNANHDHSEQRCVVTMETSETSPIRCTVIEDLLAVTLGDTTVPMCLHHAERAMIYFGALIIGTIG